MTHVMVLSSSAGKASPSATSQLTPRPTVSISPSPASSLSLSRYPRYPKHGIWGLSLGTPAPEAHKPSPPLPPQPNKAKRRGTIAGLGFQALSSCLHSCSEGEVGVEDRKQPDGGVCICAGPWAGRKPRRRVGLHNYTNMPDSLPAATQLPPAAPSWLPGQN